MCGNFVHVWLYKVGNTQLGLKLAIWVTQLRLIHTVNDMMFHLQMSCWQKRRSTRASARNSTRLSPSWPASKLLKSLLLLIIKVFNTHDTSTMLHHLKRHVVPSWTQASGSIISSFRSLAINCYCNNRVKVIFTAE